MDSPFRRKTKSGFCACAITFETQSTARQATDDNIITTHALCVLDNYGYRHTLRISNKYGLSMTTVVSRTRLNVTFIRTLPVLLDFDTTIRGEKIVQKVLRAKG
jgi:hypothetical protein